MGATPRLALSRRKIRAPDAVRPIVADFYCHAAKLAIELDGRQHEWFADYDAGRTAVIENFGIRVLRFTNADVCDELDSVLARIRSELRLPFG